MTNYEYFELKYLEEINELFLESKDIAAFNNLNLFQNPKDNFMDLFDLIYDSIEIIEEEDDEFENDTFNDEENYSML
tara:strand:- start:289 stop:519 length:231 start_codon:yes stop_codon:yes gene_type:complete